MRTGRRMGRNTKRTKTRTKTSDEDDGDGDGDGDSDDDDDDERRHRDDTRGVDERTDGAQTGWTSCCVRGYARFMLAVWAGRGAQAASCLVIEGFTSSRLFGLPTLQDGPRGSQDRSKTA